MSYLKFTSEAEAIQVLSVYHSEEGWLTGSHDHALDVIGPINEQGFHINLLGVLPEGAEAYCIEPETPQRMFG